MHGQALEITFPAATGGTVKIKYFSVGTMASGAGIILLLLILSSNVIWNLNCQQNQLLIVDFVLS